MSRARLLLLFGGASSEHEISLRSARSVLDAVDRDRFEPCLVGIRRDGGWRTGSPDRPLDDIVGRGQPVEDLRALRPDLAFPVLHGPNGEDGTIQGLLEILGIPYVGSGVLASATCMDKVAQKHLVGAAAPDIPLVPWVEVDGRTWMDMPARPRIIAEIVERLGYPCFIKPANLGSSVGVHKATDEWTLTEALTDAARYDQRIVVEKGVDAREIEVAVLGNGGPETLASAPGEIGLPEGVWYDYETKYITDVATLHIPAALDPDLSSRIRELAISSFQVMGCKGLARVDFLLDRATRTPYLNELNTMPGFTSISMYPKLMEHDGIPYPELVTRLCDLALAHHRERRLLSNER
jgi:D-alanine--D-alanine ligase